MQMTQMTQILQIRKCLLGLLLCLPLTATVMATEQEAVMAAQKPQLKADSPRQYIVQDGDTLWTIAAKFLEKPWQWQLLWKLNPHLGNPGNLHPGDILSLEMHNGQPALRISRQGVLKLSPKMRVSAIEDQIPAVPLSLIQPFLSHDLVLPAHTLKQAPYVVSAEQEHLMAGKLDFIYVYGFSPDQRVEGQEYDIYRQDEPVMDPDSKKSLGMITKYIGQGKVVRPGSITSLQLQDAKQAVVQGDRLLPSISRLPMPILNMQATEVPLEGRIVAVLDGVTQVGEKHVVIINRGIRAGLLPGDILGIYQVGDTVVDGTKKRLSALKLPDELAGEILIFRLFDDVAFGLVVNATQAMHLYDKVGNLPM